MYRVGSCAFFGLLALFPCKVSAQDLCLRDGCSREDLAAAFPVSGTKMIQVGGTRKMSLTKSLELTEHDDEKQQASTLDGPDVSASVDGVRFTRRMLAGEACDGKFASIETPEECEAAFEALHDTEKRMEKIWPVRLAFEPKGCYSKCFSEFAGHHCRRFNEKGHGRGSDGRVAMLCKKKSAEGLERYVRVSEARATCQSKDYADITDVTECSEAFKATRHDKEADEVQVVYRSRKPKGCYSDCFDRDTGYYCRTFNRHKVGSGDTSDGNNRFLLCKERQRRKWPRDIKGGGMVRRILPGERCNGQLKNIDTLEACKAAFDALHYYCKELETIQPIQRSWEPKGCFSTFFSEHAGFHCLQFNQDPDARGYAGGGREIVCKDPSVASSDDARFVRVQAEEATCESENYVDIADITECEEAMRVIKYANKGAEQVFSISADSQPKGCFSDCFDEFTGYHCRKFNTHPTGSDCRSDGVSRFLLCEERR
eukprot:TRINITY_DN8811_c0_g1_i4.p1 TRINITY_DN8811_c0_g1~~TRINITY_DN8811_c0_g1_i4.p1  ORF type:complete len:485 (-),score=65.08 TRINITY_DN8811_c0_g1_i4:47-1501(-)